jgi:hypothetical protein
MFSRRIVALILLCSSLGLAQAATDTARRDLERRFTATIHPFLEKYCFACHNGEKQKSKLDLTVFSTTDTIAQDYRRWEIVLQKLKDAEMPPEEAKQHPSSPATHEVTAWIEALRKNEAQRTAGDPGNVPVRRLSNAEYDYTIRDLTGVDIRPTREFPVDPANEAGFDNSAESLAMSPALLQKYLQAAQHVAEHLALKPSGFDFAPHPMIADTDRDKYSVKRIIQFYQRQPIDLADYFLAAWEFEHRAALGRPRATLQEIGATEKISAKYLATIWSVLTAPVDGVGPISALQKMWRQLPAPETKNSAGARAGCESMRDLVIRLREKLEPEVKNLSVRGMNAGSQPLVLWKDRQFAANRRRYTGGALQLRAEDLTANASARQALTPPADEAARAGFEKAFEKFCAIFPDKFFVSERARVYLDPEKEKQNAGRLLSAGFHSMMGYFRDDGPLYDLILDEAGQRELDGLWRELNFITSAPMRQHTGLIWFERAESRFINAPEFHFARAEDKDCTSEAKIRQLADVYLAKARTNGASDVAIEAIETHFKNINAAVRQVEHDRTAAEPSHLEALESFAERAYRRPLAPAERDDLLGYYRSLRKEGAGHEEAMRDSVVSILMSPSFSFRLDLSATDNAPATQKTGAIAAGVRAHRLSDYALANRLSYFLWSSMPDQELMRHATAGDLHRPEVLLAQTRRMLRDSRVRGLATEFGGNWLDFRRFEEHNAVDRERFKSFNNELRQAMFEEPIHFTIDVVQQNRSVLDFLYANDTFVNSILARHYGIATGEIRSNEWVHVTDARASGRGGLLPMAVFLTKNAPGLRTSPVKRGYWVVRRLLGEQIPPPPPAVPQLPTDEAKLGELTLRETLARHREDKSCAGCHARFDAMGLVFEGYGPIGELRDKDLGGRPVDMRATFPGGVEGTGLEGLRAYLKSRREQDFVDNLCQKLLTYGLGRSLIISDDGILDDMKTRLTANGHRFDVLVETIVSSPQFLNQRDRRHFSMK